MQSGKTLSSPLPKTRIYRTATSEKELKTSRTGFLQQRIFLKGHIKIGEKDRNAVQSDPTPMTWGPTSRMDTTTTVVLTKEQGV